MGCDCHGHAEIKVGGVWHHYSHPRIPRFYAFFAKIAGVRASLGVEPIAEPRGLPKDLTFTTRLDVERWGSDGHSHTWLSGDELGKVVEWFDEEMTRRKRLDGVERPWYSCEYEWLGYLFGNGWCSRPESMPMVEDVRFVAWFDN